MTKAQKEAKAKNELRLKQMLETSGAKVAGLEEPEEKKKPVYDDRKKRKKQIEEQKAKEAREAEEAAKKLADLKIAEEQAALAAAEAEKAKIDAEAKKGDDAGMDWETLADEDDGLKDSWDVDTDEEEERKASAKKAKEEKATQEAKAKEQAASAKGSGSDSETDSDDDSEDDSSEDEQGTATQRAEAVFWVTSILVKQSSSTRSDRPMCRKVRQEVSRNRLVPPTSLSQLSRRRLLWSTRTMSSSSMFPVCLSSIHLVTSPSPTSGPVARPFVTLPSWSSTSCTVSNLKLSSL
jgi:hypothetical protein